MKKKSAFILLAILAVLALYLPSSAEIIRDYKVKVILEKDGSATVSEKIKYDFEDESRHGIYRDIPLSRKVGSMYKNLDIKLAGIERDGRSEDYSVYNEDGNITFKIGKGDATISGPHLYSITYRVLNGTSTFDDHDEFYWNAIGTGWKVPVERADVEIVPPKGVPITKTTGFTGAQGSREQNFHSSIIGNIFVAEITQRLDAYQGFSVVLGFPPNTFPRSVLSEKSIEQMGEERTDLIIGLIIIGLIILNIALPVWALVWYFRGHKNARFGKPFANFDLPVTNDGQRISPAESGAIDTSKLDQNDVVGTIFDLAIRGYIKIEQVTEKSSFLGIDTSSRDYKIKQLEPPKNDVLLEHERSLLDRFGSEVKLSDLSKDFYETFNSMEAAVFKELVKKGYYQEDPTNQKNLFAFFGIFTFFLGLPLLGIALFFISTRVLGRTRAGDEIDWKTDGLKLFLSRMSANYKWQAEQLAIVEQMIPYAMALGYIDRFMEQLKIIKPDYRPGWYAGNDPFYIMTPALISSMHSNLTTHEPSSSSGFSGGGFSGGGGGGGGGGSW
ncbi:MAG TPA: DUF2207 domain-containing protein [Candidatus Omnitrophota bacterium]|nr:DUF2207 domain-containing protein [Candidatus Omnitrophota bacterium]